MSGPPPPQHPAYNPYNPYNQPPPMQPGQPYPPQPTPFGQPPFGPPPPQARRGSPVGAVFLAFFASVIISVIYGVTIVSGYETRTPDSVRTLYVVHGLINGAVVGLLIGLVGRRSAGARATGAVIAPLGAFFGYANAMPFVVLAQQTPDVLRGVLEHDPFFPAKAWWGGQTGGELIALLGLVVAAVAAWVLAYAVGRRR